MKIIDPALQTAQKTVGGNPVVTATLDDSTRPHWQELASQSAFIAWIVRGLQAGSVFFRTRWKITLFETQRITDPTVASQWTTWAGTFASNAGNPSLFYTGTYIVMVWWDSSLGKLRYTRSSDGGLSFDAVADTSSQPAAAPVYPSGVGGDATHCGLFYANTTPHDIFFMAYDPGANTWSAPVSGGYNFTTLNGLGAKWDANGSRWIVALGLQTHLSWLAAGIYVITRTSGGSWSASATLVYALSSIAAGPYGVALSLTIDTYNGIQIALTFFGYRSAGEGYFLTWLNQDLAVEDPILMEFSTAVGIVFHTDTEVYGSSNNYYYAGNSAKVWRGQFRSYNPEPPLITGYKADVRSIGRYEIDCLYKASQWTREPDPRAVLLFNRGLDVPGSGPLTDEVIFWIDGFAYSEQDNILTLLATDALGLIESWTAENTWRFDGERIDTLVQRVCAAAGVHRATFDGSAVWADTIPNFVISPDTSGLTALKSLLARAGADVIAKQNGGLYFFVPTAAPASQYTYGLAAGQHVHWPGRFGVSLAPGFLIMLASPDADSSTTLNADFTYSHNIAFKTADVARDRRLTTAADSQELVDARAVLAKELRRVGRFESPPNFALEPGDVISLGAGWANVNGPWRVTGFIEEFNRKAKKWVQTVDLRGTA